MTFTIIMFGKTRFELDSDDIATSVKQLVVYKTVVVPYLSSVNYSLWGLGRDVCSYTTLLRTHTTTWWVYYVLVL